MFLYHGTTKSVAEIALKTGLTPRWKRKSTWTVASSKHAVYLTDAYAPYFAFNAANQAQTDYHAVVVVDTKYLGLADLMPDEDALEQATRKDPLVQGSMLERTKHFRDNQTYYAAQGMDWRWSLNVLGTCCYHGVIPPKAIVKIITWDRETTKNLVFVFDPVIVLANYRFVGARYRWMMQQFARMNTGYKLDEFNRFGMQEEAMLNIFSSVKEHLNPNYAGNNAPPNAS